MSALAHDYCAVCVFCLVCGIGKSDACNYEIGCAESAELKEHDCPVLKRFGHIIDAVHDDFDARYFRTRK